MLLVIALMLADWDYAGWSLNGLVTGGWLLPVVVALWGLHRGRPLVAGAGIAWAGLIKLFPFARTLPLLLIVGREALFRERADSSGPARDEGRVSPSVRLALLTLAGTIVSAGALGAASSLSGYAWSEFLAKITTQFHYAGATGNGVGLSRLLMSLGIDTHAPLLPVQATALFVVVWMFWRPPAAVWWEGLPRRTLILLACMVWLSRKYMNYYGIVGLLLVPTLLGRNRLVTVMILLLHALSFAMPEFNVLYPGALVFLTAVKVAPYWALPLAALWQEMRGDRDPAPAPRGRVADAVFRRGAALTACGIFVSAAATGWEIWRWERAAASFAEGQRFLQEERSVEARAALVTSVRWRPSHALAQYSLGLVYERLGNRRDAARHYRLAVDADPDLTLARLNLGVLCVESGNLPEALQQFREAVRRAPYDESAHFDLGLALASHGDTGEARRHFAEALRIKPDFAAARERLGPAAP